jgi:peroxiredoxin
MENKHHMTDTLDDTSKPADKTPPKKKFQFSFSLLFLAIVIVWLVSVYFNNTLLPTGSTAPSWELETAERLSGTLSSEALRGKIVVLDFWGTGCPPCMQEMFELEAIWKDLKDKNVVVIGVASWGESRAQAFSMKQRKQITYPFVVGTQKMLAAYRIDSLPTLYLIDPTGKIVRSHLGFWDRKSLKEAILNL